MIKACLVVYDIPATPKKGDDRIYNPSDMFRRFGFRINYSCWVVPEENLPLMPLDELKQKGARVEVVRFDESEYDNIMRLARAALEAEAAQIRETLLNTCKGIRERYKEFHETKRTRDYEKAYAYDYINMRRIKQLATSIQECCMAFDLTGDFSELIDGLKAQIKLADADIDPLRIKAEREAKANA